ncbi:MAG: DUF4928 family protein [Caldilineaceae bacterium]
MDERLDAKLSEFATNYGFTVKGSISVALHVTRYAIENGLPIETGSLKTSRRGQVKGLNKLRVQSILADYGIKTVLSAEAGRTNRGTLGNVESYGQFLNALPQVDTISLQMIEAWWVERVKDFSAVNPFRFKYDQSKFAHCHNYRALETGGRKAEKRPGATYLGAVLQHLVGAKLELSLARYNISLTHYGASVADEQQSREGDFLINKTVIHVTTQPGLALIQKCITNLSRGYHPMIITLDDKVTTAEVYAEGENISQRIEIIPVEKFLATNLYELSEFSAEKREITLRQLIDHYNAIVEEYETDPSLKFSFG